MPVKNICKCLQPPGGVGQCEPHQLAICRTEAGQCSTECRDPPPDKTTREQIEAWAFSVITGQKFSRPVPRYARVMLAGGKYIEPKSRAVIHFVLPQFEQKSGSFGSSGSFGNDSSASGKERDSDAYR